MKLPTIKKILREDLKDAPSWVNGLIDPLNTFMETSYQLFNRNITFSENFASFVYELTYRTPSTYPSNQDIVRFQNQLKVPPSGVILAQILDKANYTAPTGVGNIPWVFDGTQIEVGLITGLLPSKVYTVRLVIF